MLGNKVLIAILTVALGLFGSTDLWAQSGLAQQAQQKAREGDYRAAIELYEKAITGAAGRREKDHLGKDLETVKKTYYVELAKQARSFNTTQQEKVDILSQAHSLNIEDQAQNRSSRGGLRGLRGKGDEDFQKAVLEIRTLRLKMFTALRKDAAEAARERDLARALTSLEQAYAIDPEQFERHKLNQAHDLVKDRVVRGEKLAFDGHQLLEQGKYTEAQEKLKLADSVYPGQKAVQDDLARIQNAALEYELVLGEAEAATATGDIDKARQSYQQAIRLAPERAREDGIEGRLAKLDQPAVNPFEDAMANFRAGRYADARAGFEKALELDSSNAEARRYLARADSMALLVEGKGYAEASEFERAERAFDRAVVLDRDNQEAARLLDQSQRYRKSVREGRALYRNGDCEKSKTALRAARRLAPKRFSLDALDVILNEDCAPAPTGRAVGPATPAAPRQIPLPTAQVKRGLLALFEGRVEESIQILEAVLEDVGEGHAKLHAFLGAAYSHAALMNPESDRSGLDQARAQFQLALNLEPDYQLSENLFSPRIVGILDGLRGRKN